ncbi:MAG: DNA polymerase Y family protein [Pirellulales bacterium]
MTRILCLWLPNWPIQRAARGRPELSGRPFVLETPAVRGSSVAACSRAAVARGVRVGMPVAEALALVSELVVEPYDPAADGVELRRLAAACERFSPAVALEAGDEPESLLLDVTNLTHLLGTEAELVAKVERFFAVEGYRVQAAVADTVGLAWGMAHYGRLRISDCGLRIEDLQSAIRNPQSEIFQLPIESLRIAGDTVELLHQLGITTIGQLLALPREDLTSRFGEQLLLRVDQLLGHAPEVLVPHREPAALEVGCSLEHAISDRALLAEVLAQLVDQLAGALAARDQGAVLLVCELKYVGGESFLMRIGLVEPSASSRQLMELVGLHLETVVLADEVNHVEVRAATVGRLGERQGELFADRWPTDPHQLAVLVNRLSSRLGYEQVLRPRLGGSPVPERAVRYEQGAGGTGQGVRKKNPMLHAPGSMPPRPLLLYPEPQGVEVTALVPDGPPQFVWVGGRRERITADWGPERIETLWWRGASVRRDYYRVVTESGAQLWIFCSLADGKWFLHGLFA